MQLLAFAISTHTHVFAFSYGRSPSLQMGVRLVIFAIAPECSFRPRGDDDVLHRSGMFFPGCVVADNTSMVASARVMATMSAMAAGMAIALVVGTGCGNGSGGVDGRGVHNVFCGRCSSPYCFNSLFRIFLFGSFWHGLMFFSP